MLLIALILLSQMPAECECAAPEPGDSLQVTAQFAGYSLGDYYHAVFIEESGMLFTTFAPNPLRYPGMDVFLFDHRWETVTITVVYELEDLFEAGPQIIATIVDVYAGAESYTSWYQFVGDEYGVEGMEEIHQLFGDPLETQELFDELLYLNGPDDL